MGYETKSIQCLSLGIKSKTYEFIKDDDEYKKKQRELLQILLRK